MLLRCHSRYLIKTNETAMCVTGESKTSKWLCFLLNQFDHYFVQPATMVGLICSKHFIITSNT